MLDLFQMCTCTHIKFVLPCGKFTILLKSKRVTVKDIADRAGVSRGTVDRVIHQRGRVANDVEAKVKAAIEELDYKPNLVARSLATQRTYNIATLLPLPNQDPFWQKPQIGIQDAISEIEDFGVQVNQFFFSLFDPFSFQKSAKELLESHPDGVLIATEFYSQAASFFETAAERNLPVLCINTMITAFPNLGYIGQDSFQSGVLAGRLFDISVPRLNGIVTLNIGARSIEQKHLLHKEQGLHYYFDEKGQNIHLTEIDLESMDDPVALEKELRTQLAPLTFQGIFITNSRAYRIIPLLKSLGYHDRCIIGFDLLESNKKFLQSGELDYIINQDPIKQGKMGIKTLFSYLLENQQPERFTFLPLDIVIKENCDFYS